ncbi:hypothetical protein CY34DRAFT_812504 [Suillus luteus UH-Slu-Lm8-n1]|uniref:Uncharacterized protein n=1 Tax=Suillus luteus UH-Slu-Lm8-n1 TaxID=930992 RepID=A0A0C9ZZS4_9AGAM|nr:hypothetical protein CY34DRAFT_812504 [Suillus luteus UH-Slu-Lm8-n1]
MFDSLLGNYGVADTIISSSLTLIKVTRKMCMPSMMSWTHLYVHPVVGAWVVTCSLMEHLSAGSNEVVRHRYRALNEFLVKVDDCSEEL